MNEKAHYYLDYLEKEMTIMGVLSGFSLAVPSLLVERVTSISKDSIAYDFVRILWSSGQECLIAALILMLLAAAFFYKERSLLAWYYGQIALEGALPGYTEQREDQLLRDADSWETWLPYNTAFWLCIGAAVEIVFALLATAVSSIQRCSPGYALTLVVLLCILLLWLRRNSIKFRLETDLPYFRIK